MGGLVALRPIGRAGFALIAFVALFALEFREVAPCPVGLLELDGRALPLMIGHLSWRAVRTVSAVQSGVAFLARGALFPWFALLALLALVPLEIHGLRDGFPVRVLVDKRGALDDGGGHGLGNVLLRGRAVRVGVGEVGGDFLCRLDKVRLRLIQRGDGLRHLAEEGGVGRLLRGAWGLIRGVVFAHIGFLVCLIPGGFWHPARRPDRCRRGNGLRGMVNSWRQAASPSPGRKARSPAPGVLPRR